MKSYIVYSIYKYTTNSLIYDFDIKYDTKIVTVSQFSKLT